MATCMLFAGIASANSTIATPALPSRRVAAQRTALAQEISPSAWPYTVPVVSLGATMVVSVEADIDGIPLRVPLRHELIDATTGELILSVDHAARGPFIPREVIVDEEAAVRLVEATGQPGSAGALGARLVADPHPSRTVIAWEVDPPYDARTETNMVFVVDAATGDVRVVGDRSASVSVRAYARNPSLTPTVGLFRLDSLQGQQLIGASFSAQNCVADGDGPCSAGQIAAPTNAEGDFLYPTPDLDDEGPQDPPDAFAEVSAYYHADRFQAWLRGFGFGQFRCEAQGSLTTLIANYRYLEGTEWKAYNNARFTGSCASMVLLGQGTRVDFAYDGDIVSHELGHAVVQTLMDGSTLMSARLRADALVNDAPALNESIADFLSAAYAGDPKLAEYIADYGGFGSNGGVRNISNDFTCPQSFTGESHNDSEAFAGALWQLRKRHGDVVVSLLLQMIALVPTDCSMERAAMTMTNLIRSTLGTEAGQNATDLFEARGLNACRRVVAWDELRDTLLIRGPTHAHPYSPPPLQVVLYPPPGATRADLTFSISAKSGAFSEPGRIEPALLVRRDAPFVWTYDDSDGWPPLLIDNADVHLTDISSGHVTLAASYPSPIYLAFVNGGEAAMNLGQLEVVFDAPSGDSGYATHGEDSDSGMTSITDSLGLMPPQAEQRGCVCSTGSSRPPWLLGFLVVLAGLRRRR